MSRAMASVLFILSLTNLMLCREHFLEVNQLANASHASSERSFNTFYTPHSTLHHESRVPNILGYQRENFIVFNQFEQAGPYEQNYKNMATDAIIEVIDMMGHANAVLQGQRPPFKDLPDNPSFLRYFRLDTREIETIFKMIERLLQAIGAPQFDCDRQSGALNHIPKLQLWYRDPPTDTAQDQACEPWAQVAQNGGAGVHGYKFYSIKAGVPDGIALCEAWFETYKPVDTVRTDLLGPSIEFGFKNNLNEPTFSSARTMMHELFHYEYLFRDVFQFDPPAPLTCPRDLALVTDPNDNTVWPICYGAYYSRIVQSSLTDASDRPTGPTQLAPFNWSPVFNDDCYVYCIMEIYFKLKRSLSFQWQDSPPRTGPYLPPGHPLLNEPLEWPEVLFDPEIPPVTNP